MVDVKPARPGFRSGQRSAAPVGPVGELRHLESEIERFYQAVKLTDGIIGLRNAVRAAIIITIAAWENKTSVGCHYRQ